MADVDGSSSAATTADTPAAAATTNAAAEEDQEPAAAELSSSAFATALRLHGEGDFEGALRAFQRAIDGEPQHRADAAYNMAALLHMLGRAREAVGFTAMVRCVLWSSLYLYTCREKPPQDRSPLTTPHPTAHPSSQALEARPEDPTAHVLLGTVLAETERAAVIDAYRRLVLALEAQGRGGGYFRAAHRLAALTGEGPSALVGAAPEYVREVFDAMAEEFEEKLVEHLGYRVRVE